MLSKVTPALAPGQDHQPQNTRPRYSPSATPIAPPDKLLTKCASSPPYDSFSGCGRYAAALRRRSCLIVLYTGAGAAPLVDATAASCSTAAATALSSVRTVYVDAWGQMGIGWVGQVR